MHTAVMTITAEAAAAAIIFVFFFKFKASVRTYFFLRKAITVCPAFNDARICLILGDSSSSLTMFFNTCPL